MLTAGLAAAAVVLVVTAAAAVRLVRRRRVRNRPGGGRQTADTPLDRLEYLPAVTSRAPRLSWHGSRYWFIGRPGRPSHREHGSVRGGHDSVRADEDGARELIGSAAPFSRRPPAAAAEGAGQDRDQGAAAVV